MFFDPRFLVRSLQILLDLRFFRALPAAETPARLSLLLNTNWNNGWGVTPIRVGWHRVIVTKRDSRATLKGKNEANH